ncbi:MAG: hypothetical protein Q7V48_13215 [Deltaproteobacteria bacterium]|nr:hypothetical protein [Deltaproteobacteria bacterium]
MELKSVNLARSIWLGPLIDLNPRGINIYPIIIPLLIDSYKFKIFPSPKEKIDEGGGLKFEQGEFKTKEGALPLAVNLTIFRDGLVADTRSSTKETDDFLREILTRLSEELNMSDYRKVIKKINYLSQIFISTDKSLELINPRVKEISDYLSRTILGFEKTSFELGGIFFWADQRLPINPVPFMIERALGVPFGENRYYSSAPLQTDEHFQLLKKFEEILIQ